MEQIPTAWRLSRRRKIKTLIFLTARLFVVPLLRLLIRFRIEGLQHVPRIGPAIVAANHLHNADPVLIIAAFTRPVLFMAKKELFTVPVVRWFVRQSGAFPVDRGRPDRQALRHAERLLHEGMLVGIFPEGTRSITGELQLPHPGVGLLIRRNPFVPVLPVAIWGTEVLPFNGAKGRKPMRGWPRVTVRIGAPITVKLQTPDGRERSPEEIADDVMLAIAQLLPEEYRGLYRERLRDRNVVREPSTVETS
ncbi:1-acyl-sn-glycerol-3-phosphate acyltransferase [Thermomicrobium sp. CFH 73360]|uniref:lysophospholipid acyltransferase family protein n=1 Tax=Thermomicrobium sp. CFH 73360 TaxID=2951987 RepID=UPI0020776BC5|nr:lysophospholipid acyltransferase family protein [Thermomicrobium sp. CFH 73360]MCM8747471.1 1-acyl-sn-glycerol-3-phosphate acyltransferase [Thermomicrobium sp. CFH 73360]